jgi:hypothetical protein
MCSPFSAHFWWNETFIFHAVAKHSGTTPRLPHGEYRMCSCKTKMVGFFFGESLCVSFALPLSNTPWTHRVVALFRAGHCTCSVPPSRVRPHGCTRGAHRRPCVRPCAALPAHRSSSGRQACGRLPPHVCVDRVPLTRVGTCIVACVGGPRAGVPGVMVHP